jgi:hypothetical protein
MTLRIESMFGGSLIMLALVVAMVHGNQAGNPAKANKDKKGAAKKGHGPRGGVVFDLGKHHAEFAADHDKKEVAVYFLKTVKGKKEKEWPPEPVEAKELTLVTKEVKTKAGKVVPSMTIKLTPKDVVEGKAFKFVGADLGTSAHRPATAPFPSPI